MAGRVSDVRAFYDGTHWDRLIRPQSDEQASVVPPAYPAPSVSSRDVAEPGAWPGPVELLGQQAARYGWQVALAYARGCMPHATTGRPGAERDSYSVRFARGDWQGYAIHAADAWQSIMVTGRALPPFGMMGRTELSVWLSDPDQPAAWYDAVRTRVAEQEANRKAREACNKGSHDRVVRVPGVAGAWCRRCSHGWTGNPWVKPRAREGVS